MTEETVDAESSEAASPAAAQSPTPSGLANLKAILESILFVANAPVEIASLARMTESKPDDVAAALEELAADLQGHGLRIQRSASGAQLVTAPETTAYVQRFLGVDEHDRLTRSVLVTLTIIAYKQPITRGGVERILGRSCDWGVQTLKQRGLITEVGRAAGAGRPYLYGTTFKFLEHFGLEKPEDLPPLPELEIAETRVAEEEAAAEAEAGLAASGSSPEGEATAVQEGTPDAEPTLGATDEGGTGADADASSPAEDDG
jgi:segregation and condensation protein B